MRLQFLSCREGARHPPLPQVNGSYIERELRHLWVEVAQLFFRERHVTGVRFVQWEDFLDNPLPFALSNSWKQGILTA